MLESAKSRIWSRVHATLLRIYPKMWKLILLYLDVEITVIMVFKLLRNSLIVVKIKIPLPD